MSGQVFSAGSIVNFWPDSAGPHTGTALVIVSRDMWVVTTELRRVVLLDGRYVVNERAYNDQADITLSDRHPGEGPPTGT